MGIGELQLMSLHAMTLEMDEAQLGALCDCLEAEVNFTSVQTPQTRAPRAPLDPPAPAQGCCEA